MPPTAGAGPSVPPSETRGTSGRHKVPNLLVFAVATVVVIGLAVGITVLLSRSSSESGSTGWGCGSSTKSFTPRTPAEEVLVNYFDAINARDYTTAWNYLHGSLQARYGSEDAFAVNMSEHVACVRVLDINLATSRDDPNDDPELSVSASLGIQWYSVQFADHYVTPFPAGGGSLPPFWKVQANTDEGAPPPRILDSATGP